MHEYICAYMTDKQRESPVSGDIISYISPVGSAGKDAEVSGHPDVHLAALSV